MNGVMKFGFELKAQLVTYMQQRPDTILTAIPGLSQRNGQKMNSQLEQSQRERDLGVMHLTDAPHW